MLLSHDRGSGYHIDAYAADYIKVQDEMYRETVLITPDKIIAPWAAQSISTLTIEAAAELANLKPEVIVMGCGSQMQFLSSELHDYFQQRQIGVDIMTTGAACRTYNILMSENRRVVAVLFLDR